jgi:two-component system response regulator DesR
MVAEAARLLLCEDDPRMRRLLLKRLQQVEDFEVVEACSAGEQVADAVRAHHPDLLLLDLELPGIDGLGVLEALGAAGLLPQLEVLILTSFRSELRVFQAMQAGAAGYLVKGLAATALERAIRDVLAGGTVIEARLAKRFWNHFSASQGRGSEDFGLSAMEREVLQAVARGLSNPEAAQALGASRGSIKSHLSSIYRKLGVKGRVEAAVKALSVGLIEL